MSAPASVKTLDFSVAEVAAPAELGVRAPLAGFSMLRDSLRILGAFAWGEPARLSRNNSSQLCSLMDGWN